MKTFISSSFQFYSQYELVKYINGKDISKPSNIHNMIKLFTVLHIVAKQPINIAKNTSMLILVAAIMATRNKFLMLF